MTEIGNAVRSRRGLGIAGLVVAAVLGVGYLADSAREHDGPSRLDPVVAADVLGLRSGPATALAHVLSFVGSEVVVGGIALVLLGVLLWRRRLDQAVPFAVAVAGAAILTAALKALVARPRPPRPDVLGAVDHSYSFPSGHTLTSAVLIALVVWLLWCRTTHLGRVLLVESGALLAFAIGASRVYLGYHWLTDVVASWLVALAWLGAVLLLSRPLVRAVAPRSEPRRELTRRS